MHNLNSSTSSDWSLISSINSSVSSNLSDEQQVRLTEQLDNYLRLLEHGIEPDIAKICDENPDLEKVLKSYFGKINNLHQLANIDTANESAPTEFDVRLPSDPNCLGDFLILNELGRGGMGIVYRAYQKSLQRKVAIKLLPLAAQLDSRQIARFHNEARAVGLLQHDHIVPIYSVGADNGIHYYAMQLVEGIPLDRWLSLHPKELEPNQDWQSIVGWIRDIANGLDYAHQLGVVHRDVKPSNLIVDNHGKAWITDFGLARCQNNQSLTGSGSVLGTMRYMSPEQSLGRSELVDHRTDIYSLGATLYELLTRQAFVPGEDGPSILQAIAVAVPTPLYKLTPGLPRDLWTVIQKATSKSKDERYDSAMDFCSDLNAVLQGRQTIAKPLSISKHAVRFALRHRRAVSLVATAFIIMVSWMAVNGMILRQQFKSTKLSEQRADRYFSLAQATVKKLGSQLADQLVGLPGTSSLRHDLLINTLRYYEQFASAAQGDPKLTIELADTHSRIGILVREIESPHESITHFQQSANLYSNAIANEKNAETLNVLQQKSSLNLNHLGLSYAEIGDARAAKVCYLRAMDFHEKLHLAGHTRSQLAIENLLLKNNFGLLLLKSGEESEAESLLVETSEKLREMMRADEPNKQLICRAFCAAVSSLSSIYWSRDPEAARGLVNEAIQFCVQNATHSENQIQASGEIANLYENLGSGLSSVEQTDAAIAAFERAINLRRQLLLINPFAYQYKRELAVGLNNLATCYQKRNRHVDAYSVLVEAIELQQTTLAMTKGDREGQRQLTVMRHNLSISATAVPDLVETAGGNIRLGFIAGLETNHDSP